ncbi:uncharacterized protein LOC129747963 [Uranotaenia lowii]|uniref:uncharacterized protein LOC129747963 n=1 Tax=Uranotaenia lowii TaxID=190385 RepID=UPI00247A6ED1|nr:uncharacterized protein LOC129747963 [Uranotaenia lowii]
MIDEYGRWLDEQLTGVVPHPRFIRLSLELGSHKAKEVGGCDAAGRSRAARPGSHCSGRKVWILALDLMTGARAPLSKRRGLQRPPPLVRCLDSLGYSLIAVLADLLIEYQKTNRAQ